MASSVDQSQEDQIKDLLEDLDTYRYIYNDFLATRGACAEADELRDTIRKMEGQVAALLGDPVPTPQAASTSQISSPTPPVRTPAAAPRISSNSFTGIPGDSFASPHWPSAAPSPFAAGSHHSTVLPASPMMQSSDNSRKRQRPLSHISPTTQGSSKRIAPSRPGSRRSQLDAINAEQEARLAENDRMYKQFIDAAGDDADQLKEIREEIDEQAKLIKAEIQMERDAELARALQADENHIQFSIEGFNEHDSWDLPDRTQPVKLEPISSKAIRASQTSAPIAPSNKLIPFNSDDDIQEITADSFNSRYGKQPTRQSGSFNYPHTSSLSSPYSKSPYTSHAPHFSLMPYPSQLTYSTQMTYPSQLTYPSQMSNPSQMAYPSQLAYPSQMSSPSKLSYPSSTVSSRVLPWAREPSHIPMPGAFDKYDKAEKAFDVVRNQTEIFDDDADMVAYNEKEFPEDIKNLLSGIKDIREATRADNEETPDALRVTLMKHQKIGLKWMKAKEESSHKGGILADDMGLGKTIQAIALMVARPFEDEDRRPTLIVAPKALMDQWRLEIQRHIKPGRYQLSVLIYHQRRRPWKELKKYDVIITTFGTITAHYKTLLEAEKLAEEGQHASLIQERKNAAGPLNPAAKWHRVIIDEAQNIKNPSAKSSTACCRLNSTYRWCLTGTPMMNRLEDFQSLLGFLRIRPYSNPSKFKADFVRRIKSGWGGEDVMKQLRVLVKSVCLRRTKSSKIDGEPILQLPPKVTEKVHVVFDERESQVYEELNTSTQRQITRYLDSGTLGRNYSHVLVLLLRLRQACCHPLLMQEFRNEPSPSMPGVDKIANAKLLSAAVVQRIKENDGEEDGTCPVCMDSVKNATIYIPCGHHVCSECWIRISDSATANGAINLDDDGPTVIKCQNCRGPVDPAKLTDTNAFKQVHDPSALPESDARGGDVYGASDDEDSEATASSDEHDSDSSTEEGEGGSKKKSKLRSLAELRKDALKNKAEKKKYIRRLEKGWFPSTKITKTLEILQANEDRGLDEKTIIFSQFTSLLDLLEFPLAHRGWNHTRFDGSMNLKERNAAVTAFTNDPACKIMLVSLKAGNSGLNLVAASHVIMFDPFWNPYIEDQAVDRAHRIGQVREVFVHRLLIENTVEDRIVTLQDQKRELISGALDEGGTMNVSRLDARELAYLFGVRDL
ncbi:SWI/SNF family DNA-dependent ATPase Ris1, putative [Penicillium digitatum]|uniref:SWI/SNF family DNA-dependent ATPase Ris1, putative n=3 Tax=Penicillium digitatum TaxID=36651 RepID=K9FWA8_PEND2|nr:SWI/SNF family DNA-dependent ATPase Ris1, putative [Penicillium digitatum Pd1]EKV07013.1 SWI/SNF family DNA-dependent ATPase Ris1, putative [Penicillium digitatum PHI26]EKV13978.1 SWI/SNF family DNA-dependent ATPase Ris1, putative [Penicillium digitatum Pd1]QQK46233.1 SWI/SNF family DNA-dependent ATPase Ris1, putative [Penicillium digitatum]